MRVLLILVFVFLIKTKLTAQTENCSRTITWSDDITVISKLDSNGLLKSIEGLKSNSIPIFTKNQILIPDNQDNTICNLDDKGRVIKIQSLKYPSSFSIIVYDNDGYIKLCQKYHNRKLLNELRLVYQNGNLWQVNTKEFKPDGTYFGTQCIAEYTNYGNFKNADLMLNYVFINGLLPAGKYSEKSLFAPNILLPSFFGKASRNLIKGMSIYISHPNQEYLETYRFTYHKYEDETILVEIDNQYGKNKATRQGAFKIKEQ